MNPLTKNTAALLAPIRLSPNDRLSVKLNEKKDKFLVEAYQDLNGGHAAPSWPAQNDWVQRIPEKKRLAAHLTNWELAATDYTVEIINATWPRSQIVFDADAEIVFNYILVSGAQQDVTARTSAWLSERLDAVNARRELNPLTVLEASGHGEFYQGPMGLEVNQEWPLSLYQRVACYNAMRNEGYNLFMEQGTGKTPIVVARICNEAPILRAREKRMYRSLIVVPKNIRLNWEREWQKFCTRPGNVTVLRGGEVSRIKLLVEALAGDSESDYTTIICSIDGLKRSWNVLKNVEWDLAVLDEAHGIKSVRTERFKICMELRERAARRMALTGTPISNTPLDLYALFEFCGKGMSGFSSYEAFKDFYGVFKINEQGHKAITGVQNLPFMKERLARTAFIIRKEQALPDLPAKVYDIHEVEMGADQKDYYDKIKDHLALEIESMLEHTENKQLVINNVLTKLLRLAQITSGFIVWDPIYGDDGEVISEKAIDRIDPNPKIEALVELLKDKGPNDKTIVWACWVQDIRTIIARLKDEGIDCVSFYGGTNDKDREDAERRFNFDRDCKVFIGNPAAGGVGLNLLGYPPGDETYETNCNHEIYFSQNWSAVSRSQSEDRAHRRGTRNNVRITDLCVPGTIDEEIRNRVLNKRTVAYEVGDVRDILKTVLKGLKHE